MKKRFLSIFALRIPPEFTLRNRPEKNPEVVALTICVEKNAKKTTDPKVVCNQAYQKETKEAVETSLKAFCLAHRLDKQYHLPNIAAMATKAVKNLSSDDIKRYYAWESSLIVPILNRDFVRGEGYFFIKRILIKNKSKEVEVHFDFIRNRGNTPRNRKNRIDTFLLKK